MCYFFYDYVNNVQYLKFIVLNFFIFFSHTIYTRHGEGNNFPFNDLNISVYVGDDHSSVKKNRRFVSKVFNDKYTIYVRQVHGQRILIFTKLSYGLFFGKVNDQLDYGDILITNVPIVNLAIQTADCQAVLIFDRVKSVVASVHLGWMGCLNHILKKTVLTMCYHFGCCSRDMVVLMCPSLGPCCAEFVNYKKEFSSNFWKYRDDGFKFNLWALSKDQVCAVGVLSEMVYHSNLCTKCNSGLFFSYRSNKNTGRFVTLAKICD